MAKVYRGARLVPHFREFLPAWIAGQPWYLGDGIPSLSPVRYFRFEDPDGEVGMETHLVREGSTVYQVPMTYRGAPFADGAQSSSALITTAEHSVLGTRWIYDGAQDPVWANELRRLVRTRGESDPSSKSGVESATARGVPLTPHDQDTDLTIDLRRIVVPGSAAEGPDVIGVLMGTWHLDGPGTSPVEGGLAAVVRQRAAPTPPTASDLRQ